MRKKTNLVMSAYGPVNGAKLYLLNFHFKNIFSTKSRSCVFRERVGLIVQNTSLNFALDF